MTSLRLSEFCVGIGLLGFAITHSAHADAPAAETNALLRAHCFDCHSGNGAEAGVDLAALTAGDSFATEFRTWESVAAQLEQHRMPPADADQPAPAQRRELIAAIRKEITAAARKFDGDPGHVVIRRLTSAEYGYAIQDLTGVEIDVETNFVSDAVGGAGFTNTGIVQFTQDSTLERYLEAARHVADHAVVGTGPLTFFHDPGQTGFELSAIHRIQKIYRSHGFRTAAGEGGEAFGLDRFPRAFFAAWRYQHRGSLGIPEATLAHIAREAGIDTRFAEYVYQLVHRRNLAFPTSDIVRAWHELPSPEDDSNPAADAIMAACDAIGQRLLDWQNRLGSNTDAKEEAPILRADRFKVRRTLPFEMNVNWPAGTTTAHLVLSVESANKNGTPDAVIVWKDARVQFRDFAKRLEPLKPLRNFVTPQTVDRLKFGTHPRGGKVDGADFVTVGTQPPGFELPIPKGARSARLVVTAELDVEHGEDCIVRCSIAQLEETDQGKSISGLLANPQSAEFAPWKQGVLEFARLLPQMSQHEPAPSDRDPIPAPFDATYNNPERNFFHTRIKYFRDDAFLVENILDEPTRRELDHAWADLLGSFEFHDTWLQLLADKYRFDSSERPIAELDDGWIASTPIEAQPYLTALKADAVRVRGMFAAAEPRHLQDVMAFADRAWRRPLTMAEKDGLRDFYRTLRHESQLDHRAAICALITRVLVSPAFLYRTEREMPTADVKERGAVALTPAELATRLSFLLWSSVPDDALRRAAATGQLDTRDDLIAQTRRMLRDEKSRRFSTEFFGQWFGFYRFHQYRGIDAEQFPEFTDSLRQSLYDEAVEFFDFIVRDNRPLHEVLFADYAFLNSELAAHYGIDLEAGQSGGMRRVEQAQKYHRGGLLRLGAILATTSAPRRTSPVKRGDWILRRVLGTPVPPPPADAGSISADEVVAGGASIRQRLEAHSREVSCRNCHARFDALGFALENYDPLGRWRKRYLDDQPVETAAVLHDGTEISGDEELHHYLAKQRAQFYSTLAAKLVGYSLGRREAVGDVSLMAQLADTMEQGGGMGALLELIVTSRQFRYHRGSESPHALRSGETN